jgi:hypothetical protein
MKRHPYRILYAALVALALNLASTAPFALPAGATAFTPGEPQAIMMTPPPITATATPAPSGQVVKYSGQILDYQNGYVFFTTGDGFHVAPDVKIDDAAGGGPTKLVPQTRVYARASFDTGSGAVVELSLSVHKLPDEAAYDAIRKYAIALSTPAPNPDLGTSPGFRGLPVEVTFVVEVPPKTPFADEIYLSTDQSGWSATAIRMDRVDAEHYRVTKTFSSGTKLLYRYTRGSWQSADIGQNGLQMKPRLLVVQNSDVQIKTDIVYGWQDENQFAPDLGNALPTPFNPNPFSVAPCPRSARGGCHPIGPNPAPPVP